MMIPINPKEAARIIKGKRRMRMVFDKGCVGMTNDAIAVILKKGGKFLRDD